jgi:membrane-associated protease RseP (regulator of RpoE activity)
VSFRRRIRLPSHPAFHLALLAVTALTATVVPFGWRWGIFSPDLPLRDALLDPRLWKIGASFSVPLLAILGIHELGHMLACRRYGLPATYPYFIPAPVGIGTFGAIIRIKAPITSRRALFDVGAAGPLAGFVVALPIVVWGIAISRIATAPTRGEFLEFGEPLLFRGFERIFFPATAHGAELALSPIGMAGWFGLFVTALNLLPLAQLDGGHILYAVAGRHQRRIGFVLFAVLAGLSFFWPGWILWALIVLVMGIAHPPTADPAERLDPKRRALALLCLIVFALCFTPVPIRVVSPSAAPPPTRTYRL